MTSVLDSDLMTNGDFINVVIIRLKFTKYDYCWGSTPDPAWELTALSQTP